MQTTIGLTAHDLVRRRNFLTATDVPKIVGSSPYGNAYDVFLEKTQPMDPVKASAAMTFGTRMEPIILEYTQEWLQEFYKNPELRITKRDCRKTHANQIMSCTLDARVIGMPEAIEAKTHATVHSHVNLEEWGKEELTDTIPQVYLDQVLAQMACVPELQRIWVVMWAGRSLPVVYCAERHNHLPRIAFIETACCDFWDQHILTGIPPASLPPSMDTIRRVNAPINVEQVITLDDLTVLRAKRLSTAINLLKKRKEDMDAGIRARMIGASQAITPGGHKVRLNTYNRKGYAVEGGPVTRMDVSLAPISR